MSGLLAVEALPDEEDEAREELRHTVRRLLDAQADQPRTGPDAEPGGYDRPLWELLGRQVGAAGLAVPVELGGGGAGYRECHVVLEELGRVAAPSPFLATGVLAAGALLGTGGAAAETLLTTLATGTVTAAVGWNQPAGVGSRTDRVLTATPADGRWLVDGRLGLVLDGARADVLLVFATTVDGPGLFALDLTAPGLRRAVAPTMDQSLHLAEIGCARVPAKRIGTAASAASTVAAIADLAATATTAEQVGGAARCLELTIDYLRTRVQFGRPIGSFQAVKHRLADLLVLVESARSASLAAAAAIGSTDASLAASTAKSYCSEAYQAVAAEMIQLHGGTGFTWEHVAHRHFKRAHSTRVLFGDPGYHRRRLAGLLGLPG